MVFKCVMLEVYPSAWVEGCQTQWQAEEIVSGVLDFLDHFEPKLNEGEKKNTTDLLCFEN